MERISLSAQDRLLNKYDYFLENFPFKKILSGLFILTGLVLIISGLWKGYKNKINSSWGRVDGIVVNSTVESCNVPSKENKKIYNTYFNSKITYEFSVGSAHYTHSTTIGTVTKNDPTIAQKIIAGYPEGKLVAIFYNPENTDESLINTFSQTEKWIPVTIGLIFIFLGVSTVFLLKNNNDELTGPSTLGLGDTKNLQPEKSPNVSDEPKVQALAQEITGTWKLNYQMPSMVEMLSIAMKASGNEENVNEILSTVSGSAILTITGEEMIFSYKDADNNGSCEIVSRYWLHGDRLELEHKSMDFLMVDMEDFPPRLYTFTLKGSTLVLTTKKIKGLGNRKITYHLSRSTP